MTTVRRLLVAGGTIAMIAGLAGAVVDPDAGFGALLFLAAVLILHDGVFQPLVALIALVGRRVPIRVGKEMVRRRQGHPPTRDR
jgi:hypothetical protein